jgi:carboxypeptidase family protein/TonB-dependent receptor-like protein
VSTRFDRGYPPVEQGKKKMKSIGKALRGFSWVWLIGIVFAAGTASRLGFAQSSASTLRGMTTAADAQGRPIPVGGVQIKLSGTSPNSVSLSTFSDDGGQYQFLELPGGSYELEASLEGFKKVVKELKITPGVAVTEDIHLEIEELHQQVEVRADAPTISQQTASAPSTLSSPQLITLPISQQKFKQALPLTSGVVRTPDGKINIKGSVENQGMLLVDSAETVDPVTGSFAIDMSIDAIESLEVYKTPYRAEYGGFSGGLTSIQSKPPSTKWRFGVDDFVPGIRGKNGHIVGISDDEPRLNFSGPLWANKLSISESFIYDLRKQPVRGLPWPHNETKRQGFNSFTNLQYIFSPQHLMTVNFQLFPLRQQFADISSLIPQTASSDYGQRGFSIGATDRYLLASGAVVTTLFKYTRFSSYAHGQGPQQMLVTPDGRGGNSFNAWARTSNQEEVLPSFQFPRKEWRGNHEIKIGGDVIHRSYTGTSRSHPVLLLRPDGSIAERIDFLGQVGSPTVSGLTFLASSNTEVAIFAQDHWAVGDQLALDLGLRYSGQTLGETANFAPRLGVVYSPAKDGKTIFRGGIGVFHDRVPLLAGDFDHNPSRVASFFDQQGAPLGLSHTLRNVCAKASDGAVRTLPACSDLDSTPYNITWNLELDRELPRHLLLRVGYLSSRTHNLFVVNPLLQAGNNPLLALTDAGRSRYHEIESTLRFHPTERSDFRISYVHSHSQGDLNTLSQVFVPFEQPVIRPNVSGDLPSELPDRLVSWGIFKLPRRFTFSPVLDYHSGFRYSNVDVLQNYVGQPDSLRFPNFFSFDWRVYREFGVPSFVPGLRNRKFRIGFYSNNFTNHLNPRDVFNNVASTNFGHFVGFQHRVDGLVIDFVE